MNKCLILLLACIFILTGCSKKYTDEEIAKLLGTDKLPYSYNFAHYILDVNDLVQLTTYVDYVFVGTITEYVKTEYDEYDIMTYYTVDVQENIKGELRMDEAITIAKDGGITEDHKMISVVEGDIIPKVGSTYIFCAYVKEDLDELYCFGTNTVCEIANVDNRTEDDVYKRYVEATKTTADDVPIERDYIISRYDVNYSE